MNRRGSAQDVLLIVVLLFVFGIAFLVASYSSNQIYAKMLNNTAINASAPTVEVLQAADAVDAKLDYYSMGIFFGLVLALIVTAWFVSGNPLFMGIYVIIDVIAVVVAMGLSNAWETLTQNPTFAATVSSLSFTNHVLLYLPYYAAVVGMLGIIVLFAKPFFSAGGDLRG